MDLDAFRPFLARLEEIGLASWREPLEERILARLDTRSHGDLQRWKQALDRLPDLPHGDLRLNGPCVGIEGDSPLDTQTEGRLREALLVLHPWRKGPFCIHGMRIDTEWRSDLKWDRLTNAISPLAGRLVLDVGCGNGYHAWRMLGAGARLVLGIDPTMLFVVQWLAVRRYLGRDELAVLPLRLEDLPADVTGFDSAFSMGVLYHRRSPIDHLLELLRLLRPGGELILETLVLLGTGARVLVPPDRYAAMRNVWFIPTVDALGSWLQRCGFTGVRVVDVTGTGLDEQRSTPWMHFQSLPDHLDPADPSRTIEGLPAPVRAILVASRPVSGPGPAPQKECP
jgi:tRNA (mo5U34)-methyltransferase